MPIGRMKPPPTEVDRQGAAARARPPLPPEAAYLSILGAASRRHSSLSPRHLIGAVSERACGCPRLGIADSVDDLVWPKTNKRGAVPGNTPSLRCPRRYVILFAKLRLGEISIVVAVRMIRWPTEKSWRFGHGSSLCRTPARNRQGPLRAAAGVKIWHATNVERTAEMYATARCAFEPSDMR